jgi:hypothetical protein
MNLQGCEDYLVKMNFHISAGDIAKYNDAFNECCEELRNTGEIIAKEDYTDEELLAYTVRVMEVLRAQGDPMVRRIDYLLFEGFLTLNCDGCVFQSELKFEPLTEADFSEKWAA